MACQRKGRCRLEITQRKKYLKKGGRLKAILVHTVSSALGYNPRGKDRESAPRCQCLEEGGI